MTRSSLTQVRFTIPHAKSYTNFIDNEFNSEDQTLELSLKQAAINAIRAAGAKSQYIFVEGNSWSGAWTWTTTNDNMKALTDSQDLIIYEMHQYLDSDGSGTSEICVSSTIGQERVVAATQWLKDNGKKALGEFAGGANSVCQGAVTGMLDYLPANSDVWLGASWWSAGPWWGDYMYSFEPPSGVGYTYYMSLLKNYFPGSTNSGTTTTKATTTTSTTKATATTTTTTRSSTTGAAHYAQCGGINWTGPTTCASPYSCQKQSENYSQCL